MLAGVGSAHALPAVKKSAAAPASPLASLSLKNLTAVDGTTLSLRPIPGGLSREVTVPGGRTRKTIFTLSNGWIGTVSEGDGKVAGMFAVNRTTLSTLYADGRSEILVFGSSVSIKGAVSMVAQGVNGELTCASWYPADHQFSAAERKGALVQYAKNLGLKLSRAEMKLAPDCSAEMEKARAAQQAGGAAPRPQQPAVPPATAVIARDDAQAWAAFDAFYTRFVAGHEGGFVANDGNGTPANYGINQGANPDVDVPSLTQSVAEQILYERYWLASGADRLPAALAMIHGDTAINMGVRAAGDLLAQSGGDPIAYLDLRDERYREIAAGNPDKASYLPVWLQRTEDLRYLVGNGDDGYDERPTYAERRVEPRTFPASDWDQPAYSEDRRRAIRDWDDY
jgi:hypothetical protein